MNICFFTIIDTELQKGLPNSRNLDFVGFMNSFKRFHSDIPMIVFNENDMMLRGVNWYNAKATFGKMLSETYDLVVNIDADTYIFDRLDEIIEGGYDIACPANFNQTDNLVGIKVSSGITGEASKNWLVSEVEFLQGGLIASTSKQFWEHYEHASKKYYDKFHCYENDILNLVAYLYPYKVKVLDGDCDYRKPEHNCWYGCSIINKESKAYIENSKIMLEGKPIKAYHFAFGSAKRRYDEIFNEDVSNFIKTNIIS